MKLIPLSKEHVESQKRLPFDLFDANGQLLVPANEQLDGQPAGRRVRLRDAVFAEARKVQAWRRRLMQAADELVRCNAPLTRIARAVPRPPRMTTGAAEPGTPWDTLVQTLDAALGQARPDRSWLEQVLQVHAHARRLALQRLDEGLFRLVYHGSRHADDYSAHQALRCMLVAGAVARTLGWEAGLIEAVEKAALTMNVAMRRLQDRLALHPAAEIGKDLREHIASHPVRSARLLAQGGVDDPIWLEAVRLHHDASLEARPLAQLTPGQRLALLLRRVDVYAAVLSRRASRPALTPMEAARKVCLGPDGRPDLIGAALLRTVGLYPPGSFVELGSREMAVVSSRGARADQPLVAVLVNAQGEPLVEPRLRDTARPGCAVRRGVQPARVPVDPPVAVWAAIQEAARRA